MKYKIVKLSKKYRASFIGHEISVPCSIFQNIYFLFVLPVQFRLSALSRLQSVLVKRSRHLSWL